MVEKSARLEEKRGFGYWHSAMPKSEERHHRASIIPQSAEGFGALIPASYHRIGLEVGATV